MVINYSYSEAQIIVNIDIDKLRILIFNIQDLLTFYVIVHFSQKSCLPKNFRKLWVIKQFQFRIRFQEKEVSKDYPMNITDLNCHLFRCFSKWNNFIKNG